MDGAMTSLSGFEADWPAISALLDEALSLPVSEHTTWLTGLGPEHAAYRDLLRSLLQQRRSVESGAPESSVWPVWLLRGSLAFGRSDTTPTRDRRT